MRVLVLGGTAWVGRVVAQSAHDAGHEVTCLARGSAPFPAGVAVIRADRGDPSAYDDVPAVDRVIDVARDPRQVAAAVAALAGRCGRYVFVSTGNVYADHASRGGREAAPLLAPLAADVAPSMESYGEAKVACENAVAAAFPDRHVLARAGLIGGPGDTSGRTAYWPWRFDRNGDRPVLVPAAEERSSQVIDVRDLADWLLRVEAPGAYNLVGDVLPLPAHLAVAREVGGHCGPVIAAPETWLAERGVAQWSGDRSLPLWLTEAGWEGFAARSNARAKEAGLTLRPLAETLADALAWSQTVEMPCGAGLSDAEEAELLTALA